VEYSSHEQPDNRRCVAAPEELAAAGPAAPGAERGGAGGSASPAGAARTAPKQAERSERLVAVEATDANCPRRVAIAAWDEENRQPEVLAALRAGSEIKLVLWSEVPNDFDGVTFFAGHRIGTPSVSEAKWVAHLQREQAKREREWQTEQAEADKRRAFCAAHHEDETCWGTGGYAAWQRAHEQERARPAPPEPHAADRPPPPAHVETPPPRPSLHAEWIPGRWTWEGLEYRWLAGLWRVPEEDRASGQTAEAPTPPPAARREAVSAAPAPGWVWTPGYWAWTGAAWVWAAGSWQVPPAGASWRPSRWINRGARVRLDPGGWIR
jgi:hypothetical protein